MHLWPLPGGRAWGLAALRSAPTSKAQSSSLKMDWLVQAGRARAVLCFHPCIQVRKPSLTEENGLALGGRGAGGPGSRVLRPSAGHHFHSPRAPGWGTRGRPGSTSLPRDSWELKAGRLAFLPVSAPGAPPWMACGAVTTAQSKHRALLLGTPITALGWAFIYYHIYFFSLTEGKHSPPKPWKATTACTGGRWMSPAARWGAAPAPSRGRAGQTWVRRKGRAAHPRLAGGRGHCPVTLKAKGWDWGPDQVVLHLALLLDFW